MLLIINIHGWSIFQPAIQGPLVPCLFILMEYADMGNIMDYILLEDLNNDIDHNDKRRNKNKKYKDIVIRNGKRWLPEREI